MTSTIDLTQDEQLALQMLQSHPVAIQAVAKNGTIDLGDMLVFYERLTDRLRFAKIRRRQEYIEVEGKPTV